MQRALSGYCYAWNIILKHPLTPGSGVSPVINLFNGCGRIIKKQMQDFMDKKWTADQTREVGDLKSLAFYRIIMREDGKLYIDLGRKVRAGIAWLSIMIRGSIAK